MLEIAQDGKPNYRKTADGGIDWQQDGNTRSTHDEVRERIDNAVRQGYRFVGCDPEYGMWQVERGSQRIYIYVDAPSFGTGDLVKRIA